MKMAVLGLNALARIKYIEPVSIAARSTAWVCGHSPAGVTASNPAGAWMFVSCECCVL